MKYLYLILCVWAMSGLHRTYALEIPFQQDTLKQDSILTTPYVAKRSSKSFATFSFVKKDEIAFQTYAGLNVLNTLRGHIPNLVLGPNASQPSGLFRGGQGTLVIDGLPHSSDYGRYYNLNSFEFESIYAQPSGSAALEFGGQAANGVVYLESKNGRDVTEGAIEVNIFPTLISNSGYLSNRSQQLWLANAISYAHDFGVFDTRVSYTGNFFPDDGSDPKIHGNQHFLKVNSGVEFSKRFTMRLIQDIGVRKDFTGFQNSNAMHQARIQNLEQKLIVKYQPSNWFTLRYQSSLASLINTESQANGSELRLTNTRVFANVMAIFQKTTDNIAVNAFAGGLYEHQNSSGTLHTMNSLFFDNSGSSARYNMQSFIAGFGVHKKTYWFNDVKLRIDQFNTSFNTENEPAYSVSSSFIFSEVLDLENTWLSFGKVRASIGAAGVNPVQSYPFVNRTFYLQERMPASLKSEFNRRTSREIGADLTFYHKLDFSMSYFKDKNAETITRVLGPVGYYHVDAGETHTNGFETVLSGNVFQRSNVSLATKLIWATYHSKIIPRNATQGSGSEFGNPTPDWLASLLSQLTARNFFTHVLLDMRKGGDLLLIRTPGNYELIDATNIVLRDVSVGYTWPVTSEKIQRAQISVSARNIFTLYSNFDGNVESWINSYPAEKSFSVSMSLRF